MDEALEEDMGVKCACGCNEVCTVGSLRKSVVLNQCYSACIYFFLVNYSLHH